MESIPQNISLEEKQYIFEGRNLDLNRMILEAFLHGLYTGIVTITLWTMLSRLTFGRFGRRWNRRTTERMPEHARDRRDAGRTQRSQRFLFIIIVMLYLLATIGFSFDWAFLRREFIEYGDNFFTAFQAAQLYSPWWIAYELVDSITGGIGTFLVDITLIWRCWVIWDRQWRIVTLPAVCALAGTAAKIVQLYSVLLGTTDDVDETSAFDSQIAFFSGMYIAMTLATTLLCTALIVYRILRVSGVHSYRGVLVVLIESSALYSLSLIVNLAFVIRDSDGCFYADTIMMYIKSIAPTLLVARVPFKFRRGDTHVKGCDSDLEAYPDPGMVTVIICRCRNVDEDGELKSKLEERCECTMDLDV